MNEKTQTLVRYDMEEDATHGVVALQRPDGIWVHYDAAAAALTALARDLAVARQERAEAQRGEQAWVEIAAQDARDAADRLAAAVRAARAETETAIKERDEARALHQELMFQVGKKFPGETRHETAKRYIQEHEDVCGHGGPASAAREGQ